MSGIYYLQQSNLLILNIKKVVKQPVQNLPVHPVIGDVQLEKAYANIILVETGSTIEQILRPGVVKIDSQKIGDQQIVFVSNPNKLTKRESEPLYFEFL